MKTKLRDVCHARAGDKGATVNIGLACYDTADYSWIVRHVTADRVLQHLGRFGGGPAERYELPRIGALNFLVHNALDGGVTCALMPDGHGKGYSAILLEMEIDGDPPPSRARQTARDAGPTAEDSPNGDRAQAGSSFAPVARVLRLGAGSAHEGDDLDAACALAENGALDYIAFDCTSEKAVSIAYARMQHGLPGYDIQLEGKLRAVLPGCVKHGTRILANSGAFDPEGAARLTVDVCRDLGLTGLKVAYVTGSDVTDLVRRLNPAVRETGEPVSTLGENFVGALAYGGYQAIVDALNAGAHIVITSRAGDSEQFLAPMIHEFGWQLDDWDKIASGIGVGHLLECGAQITGGYFADPGRKDVTGLHRLGFPIAEVDATGSAVITKLSGTGGVVDELTCKEQLLYEIGDPAAYVHAPGVVDFTTTTIRQEGPDRVRVEGTTGKPRTDTARVALVVRQGAVGMGRVVYGGTGAYRRARLAADMVGMQLQQRCGVRPDDMRFDYIGCNALYDWGVDPDLLMEVELRVTARFATTAEARMVQRFVSQLPVNGPAGAAWGRPIDQGGVEDVVTFFSTLVPHDCVVYTVHDLVT